ncbi:comE operon protein 1 [Arthrobacter sp. Hiyo8]|nr:comE operon protein 1 [Arthrobacter sp. Hiyo8]
MAGAVKNPGIVRVPAGARVFDAIAAAGGADTTAQLDSLNLAAIVEDSAKIHVPRLGEAVPSQLAGPIGGAPTAGGAGTGTSGGGKVNLNTATAEELDALPKVGPSWPNALSNGGSSTARSLPWRTSMPWMVLVPR